MFNDIFHEDNESQDIVPRGIDNDISDIEQASCMNENLDMHSLNHRVKSNASALEAAEENDFRTSIKSVQAIAPRSSDDDLSDIEQASCMNENHDIHSLNHSVKRYASALEVAEESEFRTSVKIVQSSEETSPTDDIPMKRSVEFFLNIDDEEEIQSTTDGSKFLQKRNVFRMFRGGLNRRNKTKLKKISKSTRHPHVGSITNQNKCRHDLTTSKKPKGIFESLLSCNGFSRGDCGNQETGHSLILYFHWTFRTSFPILLIAFLMKFMILILLFSGLIFYAVWLKPTCIFPSAGGFSDVFSLSWTTFTTVGYGSVHPSLKQHLENGHCGFMDFITSMEAFVGVLYAGFCGAIIFSKVIRIQSQAQVRFSDPLLIRYGPGVTRNRYRFDIDPSNTDKNPCPVLEFRIVNRFHDKEGCEIIDASIRCMVLKAAAGSGRAISLNKSSKASMFLGENADLNDVDYNVSKLDIEMSHHPFFKMLWTARHALNETSPLLTSKAKKLIRRNQGYWPNKLNSAQGVRDSINFDQVIVNLTGTSNISANHVYAQKIYHLNDLSVGYKFVNIVYKNGATGKLSLDMDVINSVNEQDGGGGEPIRDSEIFVENCQQKNDNASRPLEFSSTIPSLQIKNPILPRVFTYYYTMLVDNKVTKHIPIKQQRKDLSAPVVLRIDVELVGLIQF